jgi:hypothetical protein
MDVMTKWRAKTHRRRASQQSRHPFRPGIAKHRPRRGVSTEVAFDTTARQRHGRSLPPCVRAC